MNKLTKQNISEGAIKALVNLIPGLGGAIGSILSDTLAARKEQRINEFLQNLKNDIDENKELMNKEFVNKGDFLDLFEYTANKIQNERSEIKRNAFKEILVHGILSTQYSFDVVEAQLKLLDVLNSDHILLLSLFKSPQTFNPDFDSKINSNTYMKLFRQLLPNWEVDYIFDNLRDLENYRLIENVTNNFQTMMSAVTLDNLKSCLTSRGATFISLILK